MEIRHAETLHSRVGIRSVDATCAYAPIIGRIVLQPFDTSGEECRLDGLALIIHGGEISMFR